MTNFGQVRIQKDLWECALY